MSADEIETGAYYPRSKRNSLTIQWAAIRALFLRELQTRFGHYRLGYLWAILEPGLHIGFLLAVVTLGLGRQMSGMSYGVFLLCGILPWFMFTRSASRALGAIEGNRGLFNYRPVLPIDAVIARTALEGVLYFGTFVLFTLFFAWIDSTVRFNHVPLVICTWLVLWLLSLGFSLLMMVFGYFFSELAKVMGIVFMVLYFSSGIMFSLHLVPEKYQHYLLWNPVVHAFEFIRFGVYDGYPIGHVDYEYLLIATLTVLFFGLFFYRAYEKRMMTS